MKVTQQVSRVKSVTTIVVSFAIMLGLFGIFVLIFNDRQVQQSDAVYIVDAVNRCGWEKGVITTSTEAYGELTTEDVAAKDIEAYLEKAEEEGRCIARLGDDAGSYASSLNTRYAEQYK